MNGEVCPNARFCGPPGFTSRGNPFTNVYGLAQPPTPGFNPGSGLDNSFRKYCFQPAFVTPCASNTVNCITGYAHRGGCYYGSECRSGSCKNGMCMSSFDNDNAKVINSLSHNDFVKYAASVNPGRRPDDQCAVNAVCKQGMVLANIGGGRKEVLCPLPNPVDSQPQYQQALMRVWQPDRFKDSDPEAYRVAKDLQSCFFQDVQYPNGTTAPVAVKMTPKCLAAAQAAIEQVAHIAGTCTPDLHGPCGSVGY